MLLGTYQAKFAPGHRVAVPSSLRKHLESPYILAKWYEECLVIVPKSSWDALLLRVTGEEKLITSPIRGSEHFLFSSAYEVEPDDQGRIIVPDKLMDYAHLKEDIYFLGVKDRVEIWDKEIWDEQEKVIAEEAFKYIEELSKK